MRTPICLLVLAAATTLSAAPSVAQEARPWYQPGSRRVNLTGISGVVSDTMGLARTIEAPAADDREARVAQAGRVFAALAQVYAQLKVPPDLRDSARMIVGNQQFRLRSDLGGRSLAMYLECGQDAYGMYAEIAPVYLTLLTFLTPMGGSTIEVRTVVAARAVEIPRVQPSTRDCRSTSQLELRIYQLLVKALEKEGYRGSQ